MSLWILLPFAICYSITVLVFYFIQHLSAIEPWIPIDAEVYYLHQAFWTVPWGLGTGIMLGGISHLLATAGKRDVSQYRFEDALMVCSVG